MQIVFNYYVKLLVQKYTMKRNKKVKLSWLKQVEFFICFSLNINFTRPAEERRKKIADLLKAIEERLLSLETEKEELKQYQKWDRSKRGLECAICMAECDEAKKRIDEVNFPQ